LANSNTGKIVKAHGRTTSPSAHDKLKVPNGAWNQGTYSTALNRSNSQRIALSEAIGWFGRSLPVSRRRSDDQEMGSKPLRDCTSGYLLGRKPRKNGLYARYPVAARGRSQDAFSVFLRA
jgi:hypothetical protein